MITGIEVTNFQSHKQTYIRADKGITVVKGISDSGKSALVKGCRWLMKNRPLGFSFKSWFSKEKETTSVAFEFDNDLYIKRERNKSKNVYKYSFHSKDGKEILENTLEALKGECPDEIREILNMSDVNLQCQIDRYFMLEDTAGERGKKFNEVCNLTIIDEVIKKADSTLKKVQFALKNNNENIAQLQEQIGKFPNLESVEEQVNDIDTLQQELQKTIDRLIKAEELTVNIKKLKEAIEDLSLWDDVLGKVNDIFVLLGKWEVEKKRLREAFINRDTINKLIDSINSASEWKDIIDIIEPILNTIKEYNLLKDKVNNIIVLNKRLKEEKENYEICNMKAKECENKFRTMLKENGVCPLCGSTIGD